jgi:polysaccharide pyruvyl transferase WcaK-like protein
MKREKAFNKIGIFGYFGAWNLGDEAVVGVLIKNIRKRHPHAEIYGICLNPENTQLKHGIPAFPLRRLPGKNAHSSSGSLTVLQKIVRRLSVIAPKELIFLFQSFRRLKGFDLIFVGGSGQLIDNEGGPLNHPYNHFKWIVMAKLRGIRFMFLSVGAGPIYTGLGKWFLRNSLSLAAYRSFRDEYSKNLVESIGVNGNNIVCPDQAFSTEIEFKDRQSKTADSPLVVGFAPIAYYDPRHWSETDQSRYEHYLEKMTEFAAWLIKTDHHILFFHTQVHGDDRVIEEIREKLEKDPTLVIGNKISEHRVGWYTDAFEAIAKADVIVASRFHAVVFSYIMNRPAVGISYDPKINNIMKAVGQSDFTLNIDTFRVNELIEKFSLLKAQSDDSRNQIHETIEGFKKQIEKQYDQVLS